MFRKMIVMALLLCQAWLWAQDAPDSCTVVDKSYSNSGNFEAEDFLTEDQGILIDSRLHLDTDQKLDLENLVLGLDQPFYIDYLAEGAGASHLFGFFFLDIDTDRDGLPDFLETGPKDDLDGDGLVNEDDDDDDADGIPDSSDTGPAGVTSMPASFFRYGTIAVANSDNGTYWQFVPNSVIDDSSSVYDGYYENPATYLYIDNDGNKIPDVLEYNTGANKIPPYVVDRGYRTQHATNTAFFNKPQYGLLGNWTYEGTPGNSVDDKYHWTGSTVFYIADDDGGTGQVDLYLNYTPYGNQYADIDGRTDAWPDYLIYGTTDITSDNIPDELKNADGSAKLDKRGEELFRYRWYESNISGARELVFFLVVFYGSGSSNVNTYYSKSAFNKDPAPGTPTPNGATTGDAYGGTNRTNWFPTFRNKDDHDYVASRVWDNTYYWSQIATSPTDGSSPRRKFFPSDPDVTQDWIDEWENWDDERRVIQFRALADWFDESGVDEEEVIYERYGIDMSAENDSALIRASNGNMVHMMIGAPQTTKDAWLLGWEDLYNGGDRDFEDVVFYVKREAGGQLQSLNVAQDLKDAYAEDADYSLSQVTFTFEDNFLDNQWGTETRYINYYYRFGNADAWIPLLGGKHERTPDLFQEGFGGSTTTSSGVVSRTVTIQVESKQTDLYWKVEMSTDNVDTFQPAVSAVNIGYQSLVHDFYYNSAVIPNSNINYYGAYEAPSVTWSEARNRGHFYALQSFEHGNPPQSTTVPSTSSPESTPEQQPSAIVDRKVEAGTVDLFKWDAAVTLKTSLEDGNVRTLYTYLADNPSGELSTNLRRKTLGIDTVDPEVVSALALSSLKNDNIWLDNYQDPGATTQDKTSAALWLVNWLHGYDNPVIADGEVVSRDELREWVMGGVNRSSALIIRPPGIPRWLENGKKIPISTKRSYLSFADEQSEIRTRVIIGTESGFIHCLDAGLWVGEAETGPPPDEVIYQWAEGHYKDEDFGTGAEVWGFLPGHLLEDVKYNYRDGNPNAAGVVAKTDATGISSVILDGNDWRRVAVFSQGYKGGTQIVNGKVRTGNVIWALDITDPADPIPLWQRADEGSQDLINPPAMGWVDLGGSKLWLVGYSSGGSPVTGTLPAVYLVNAATGALAKKIEVGTESGRGDAVMMGTPAFMDSDTDGYIDYVFGATSEGILFAYNTATDTLVTQTVANASFYLTPNIDFAGDTDTIAVVATSGDSPLIYDEPATVQNKIYVYHFAIDDATFSLEGTIDLKAGHKIFSRPKIIGSQLLVGTTTGDTFNFCDFDPSDPGDLILYDLDNLGTEDVIEYEISQFGSILAPIIVSDGRVFAHRNTSDLNDPGNEHTVTGVHSKQTIQAEEKPEVTVGEVFGIAGWQDELVKKVNENIDTESETP